MAVMPPGVARRERPRIRLRPMAVRDLRAVRRIESRAYQDAWPQRLFESELANAFSSYWVAVEDRVTRDPIRAWLNRLLRRTERVLGFVGVWYMVDQLHLVTIAVDPDQQRRGIGMRLLVHALASAVEADLPEVVLEVRESNTTAQALYDWAGFRRAGRRANYYQDDGEAAIVMLSPRLAEDEGGAGRALVERLRGEVEARQPGVFAWDASGDGVTGEVAAGG